MNEFSSTKTGTGGGLSFPKKASSRLVPRDSAKNRDKNTQICSRVGCGTRINSAQGNPKPKTTRTDPCKKLPSHQTSSLPLKADASKPVIRPNNPEIKLDKIVQSDVCGEASSSSSNLHIRNGKKIMRRSELCINDSSTGASSSSLAFKNGNHGVRNGASTSKHRLSNVVQSSELNLGRKRIGEAECSLPTRGKKINGENSHGGISIRTSNSPSVGSQRSTAGVRRLNAQDDNKSNRLSNVFVNEETVGQYSLDEIAEILLALERIEQDEETSYEEQLVVLETNLFLSGVSLHDQHREMRLDIDNMSYEELLALEERMGNVSTALSEEALTKCLKKSIIYNTDEQGTPSQGDDIKCSICQEGYKEGNEVGKLICEHKYHVECIEKWLRLKNWCPICKASAAPSPSPS